MVKRREQAGDQSGSDTAASSVAPSPSPFIQSEDASNTSCSLFNVSSVGVTTDWNKVSVPFKSPNFHRTFSKSIIVSGKKRQWRTLKQILVAEAIEATNEASKEESNENNGPTYGSIDGPPSFKPAKKYSDISGLEAHYTDPHTKLNFAVSNEYKVIKKLPSDIVAGYLTLRRANVQLQ